jgi:hypothetical protein
MSDKALKFLRPVKYFMTANKSMTSRRFLDSTDSETSRYSKIGIFGRVKASEGIRIIRSDSEYFMVRLSSSAFPFELYRFQKVRGRSLINPIHLSLETLLKCGCIMEEASVDLENQK